MGNSRGAAAARRGAALRIAPFVLAFAVLCQPAHADFFEALEQYQHGDFAGALAEFQRLAQIGDHRAQFNIGVMYLRGESLPVDLVQAYAWMSLATQGEDPSWRNARDAVYRKLGEEKRPQADAARTDLHARLSDEVLASQLAPTLPAEDGIRVHSRIIKRVAPEYPLQMRREGRQGWVDVVFAVAPDGSTRLHGIMNASNAAFATAVVEALKQFRFEPSLLNGKPVEEYGIRQKFIFHLEGGEVDHLRIRKRLDELQAQADKGGPREAYEYATALEIYRSFDTLEKSYGNPNQWFWKAAARGNASAQFALGNNLLNGNACAPDAIKGVQWLKRAAEAGQSEAQYVLGTEMLSGARLEQNRTAALTWLRRSAEHHFAAASLKLAWLLSTSTDAREIDVAGAEAYLRSMPDGFIDTLSLRETQAAVAAARADFGKAVKLESEALDEARRYALPEEAILARLASYRADRRWQEPA